jgi:hypothetical protein
MDRLNRDFRRAIDFESMEMDPGENHERRMEERLRGLSRQQIETIPNIRIDSRMA